MWSINISEEYSAYVKNISYIYLFKIVHLLRYKAIIHNCHLVMRDLVIGWT